MFSFEFKGSVSYFLYYVCLKIWILICIRHPYCYDYHPIVLLLIIRYNSRSVCTPYLGYIFDPICGSLSGLYNNNKWKVKSAYYVMYCIMRSHNLQLFDSKVSFWKHRYSSCCFAFLFYYHLKLFLASSESVCILVACSFMFSDWYKVCAILYLWASISSWWWLK